MADVCIAEEQLAYSWRDETSHLTQNEVCSCHKYSNTLRVLIKMV